MHQKYTKGSFTTWSAERKLAVPTVNMSTATHCLIDTNFEMSNVSEIVLINISSMYLRVSRSVSCMTARKCVTVHNVQFFRPLVFVLSPWKSAQCYFRTRRVSNYASAPVNSKLDWNDNLWSQIDLQVQFSFIVFVGAVDTIVLTMYGDLFIFI